MSTGSSSSGPMEEIRVIQEMSKEMIMIVESLIFKQSSSKCPTQEEKYIKIHNETSRMEILYWKLKDNI